MRLLVYVSLRYKSLLGDNGKRGTPDTIPNSEVKPFIADGTIHKSMGE